MYKDKYFIINESMFYDHIVQSSMLDHMYREPYFVIVQGSIHFNFMEIRTFKIALYMNPCFITRTGIHVL